LRESIPVITQAGRTIARHLPGSTLGAGVFYRKFIFIFGFYVLVIKD